MWQILHETGTKIIRCLSEISMLLGALYGNFTSEWPQLLVVTVFFSGR